MCCDESCGIDISMLLGYVASSGMRWCDLVWCNEHGVVRYGELKCVVVWCSLSCCMVWRCNRLGRNRVLRFIWSSIVWYDMVCHGLLRYGEVRWNVVQYDATCFGVEQSRSQEFERLGVRGDFRQMYRQEVSNVPTNIKEKSKLTKPRARETGNLMRE